MAGKFEETDSVDRCYGNRFTRHDHIITSARYNWKISFLFEKAVSQAILLKSPNLATLTFIDVKNYFQNGFFHSSSKSRRPSDDSKRSKSSTKTKKFSEPIFGRGFSYRSIWSLGSESHTSQYTSLSRSATRQLSSKV